MQENNKENVENPIVNDDITKENASSKISEQKKAVDGKLIIIGVLIVVVIALAFILIVSLNNKGRESAKVNNPSTSTIGGTTESITTNAKKSGIEMDKSELKTAAAGTNYKGYYLDLSKFINKGRVHTTLANGVVIDLDIKGQKEDDEIFIDNFNFYINENLAFTLSGDDTPTNDLVIYTIAKYVIVNKNIFGTDLRSEHHVVYDNNGKLIKDLKDFNSDKIAGMVVGEGNDDAKFMDSIFFTENEVIFIGTRYNGASTLIINDGEYTAKCDPDFPDDVKKDYEYLKTLPSNFVVRAEYHYELKDGVIDFDNPQIKVLETIKDVTDNISKCLVD